ncbi:MAG: PfkB family carbohydrate kinase [Pseudomonadota bacterium]
MTAHRIDVLGSINVDLSTTAARLPLPGETVAGGEIAVLLGGKGANQAIAAARAGGDVAMWGAVGAQSFGIDPVAAIADAGVDVSGVAQLDGTSGAALIAVDAVGENCIVVSPGANGRAAEVVSPSSLRGGWLLAQLELAPALVAAGFAAAKARGARTALNAAPAIDVPDGLLADTDVLIVNETELAAYARRDVPADAPLTSVEAAARTLLPATVIVTLGARGALIVEAGGARHVPAPRIQQVDATGAGDCFCGALIAGLAAGEAMEAAAAYAVRAAALSATRRGAAPSIPERSEVLAWDGGC